jgi:uncharacterized integral membrane protein
MKTDVEAVTTLQLLGEFSKSLSSDVDQLRFVEDSFRRSVVVYGVIFLIVLAVFSLLDQQSSSGFLVYYYGDRRVDFRIPAMLAFFAIVGGGTMLFVARLFSYRYERYDRRLQVEHKSNLLQEMAGALRRERDRSTKEELKADLPTEFRLLEAEEVVKRARRVLEYRVRF